MPYQTEQEARPALLHPQTKKRAHEGFYQQYSRPKVQSSYGDRTETGSPQSTVDRQLSQCSQSKYVTSCKRDSINTHRVCQEQSSTVASPAGQLMNKSVEVRGSYDSMKRSGYAVMPETTPPDAKVLPLPKFLRPQSTAREIKDLLRIL